MHIKSIQHEIDHKQALNLINLLWEAQKDSEDHDKLEILGALVDFYEENSYDWDFPHPIASLHFYMQQKEINLEALEGIFGSQDKARRTLKLRRQLSLAEIWQLYKAWSIPPEALIKPYRLVA